MHEHIKTSVLCVNSRRSEDRQTQSARRLSGWVESLSLCVCLWFARYDFSLLHISMRHLLHNIFVLFCTKLKIARKNNAKCSSMRNSALNKIFIMLMFLSVFLFPLSAKCVLKLIWSHYYYTPIKLRSDCETLWGSQCGRWREKRGGALAACLPF